MRKDVRTKTKKSERIEIRCTKAFKEKMHELSVQNNMSISQLIESICTDKFIKEMSSKKVSVSPLDTPPKENKTKAPAKRTNRETYEREIWRMLQENATPTETAEWLNLNGFKPQRGDQFTMNSVHSIRRRLKREKYGNT
ncbi:hypothetical protein BCU50_023185 [Vibrio sp. 10N.286.46.E10]|uniref:hypothetical protein n=1 Tax=Vibrio sp. 10N.286.46.E10 TaxID=1884477 RepID=UPI000C814F30|nr:hypothetical protein [Vibrio sp. 10N.286.46.E10]PMI24286.1 hypothetical protein BCU50_04900 [Vibrio sp. 10N.286.46.E10]